jgi:hypothetical protein
MKSVSFRNVSLAMLLIASALVAPVRAADLSIFAAASPQSQTVVDHTAWGEILGRYVQAKSGYINRFDYARVTAADRAKLQSYLARLQEVDPAALAPAEQHAYWINFYNALTIEIILKKYPVGSIRDISSGWFSFGPWDLMLVTVKGQKLSLNNIEHGILRKFWKDSRVHYALNCASMGCPDLAATPYSSRSLDAALNKAARAFVNHPRGVSLLNGRLILSSIYDWYRNDFDGGSDKAVIASIRKYAEPQLSALLLKASRIDGYQYDWRLNAPGAHFELPQ